MKKTLNVLIVLMLLVSLAPLAFAEDAEDTPDDVEIDAETQTQLRIMNATIGAEIRLLQLEKAIYKNMLKGDEVVLFLQGMDINTTELEAILAEFGLLKEEVASADTNSTNTTQIFVDLKHDAINLTKDFRDALKEILDNDTIKQIREQIKNMTCVQVQNLSKKIQNKIKQFNRNQIYNIFKMMGVNDNSSLNQYQNGTCTMQQIKQNISKTVNQWAKDKKYDIFYQLKQNNINGQLNAKNCTDKALEEFNERKQNRIINRIQKFENMTNNPVNEKILERMRNKLNDGETGSGENASNSDNENPGNGQSNSGNGNQQQNGGGGA